MLIVVMAPAEITAIVFMVMSNNLTVQLSSLTLLKRSRSAFLLLLGMHQRFMCFLASMITHNMVVQALISWKMLTRQCLIWNVECLGLDTHVHNIHCFHVNATCYCCIGSAAVCWAIPTFCPLPNRSCWSLRQTAE